MQLYDLPISGNAYKVRLFVGLIGKEIECVPVNMLAGEHRTEEFLRINPRGQVPAFRDGDVVLWDSQAILTYLARTYAPEWFPDEPYAMARVMAWLAVAQNELLFGLARARAARLFGRAFNLESSQSYGRRGLRVLEGQLQLGDWLATSRPTIADVACFPYVALCEEGEVDRSPYPAVNAWIERIKGLEGFVTMPGIGK